MIYTDRSPIRPFVTILIADGKFEERILSKIALKIKNDTVSLFSPSTPLGGQKGLKPVLTALKIEIARFSNPNFLIVIDREHVSDTEQIIEGVRAFGIEPLEEGRTEYYFKAKLGPKIANVYISIQGSNKNIEEEVSILIRQIYNQTVNSDKKEIKYFLNENHKKIEDLIVDSNLPILKKSFPCLIQALECISSKNQDN